MNFIGNIFATLFSSNQDPHEKISDYIDLEDVLSPFVFYNSRGNHISILEVKEKIPAQLQIPFCLEFEKKFKGNFDEGLHIQSFYCNQKGVVKNYLTIFTSLNSEEQKAICKEITDLFTKYKGECSFIRNDHFKKYLKFFADTGIEQIELKNDDNVNQLLDKKDYDIHVNYLKIGKVYYSILTQALTTAITPIQEVMSELDDMDFHLSYRIEKPMTPESTIAKVINVLSDEQATLETSACASTLQVKVWANTEAELYEKINKVSRAFNYHGITLYINNDDMFFDFINTLPALKQELKGEIKIESINCTVYELPLFN